MARKVTIDHSLLFRAQSTRYSQRLNVFVSWMMANSLCYDERINNTDITQLWRHSRSTCNENSVSSQSFRSITEDIAQAETKLRDLRKERAQEVILRLNNSHVLQVKRVAEAREEVQEARRKHSGARDKLDGKDFAPMFLPNIHLLFVTYLLQYLYLR